MTSKELDERIDNIEWDIITDDDDKAFAKSIKQLIRDCIAEVTPKREPDYAMLTGKPSSRYNKAIDTIEATTEKLLGTK